MAEIAISHAGFDGFNEGHYWVAFWPTTV